MRTRLLMLVAAAGLAACVTAKPPAATPATAAPSAAGGPTQTAVWMRRNLQVAVFGQSCDEFYQVVSLALLQLGARANDLDVSLPADQCHQGPLHKVTVDATFWVLAPIDNTLYAQLQERFGAKSVAGAVVEAHWQPVELKEAALRAGGAFNARGRALVDSSSLNKRFGALPNPARCSIVGLFQRQMVPLFFTRDAKNIDDCNLRVQALYPEALAASR